MSLNGRLRTITGHRHVPFVVGSTISITLTLSTSNMRIKRDSVRTKSIHDQVNRREVLNISTRSIRRTLTTRQGKTSCLNINTVCNATAGPSTGALSVRALRRVYRTIDVPIIKVKNVTRKGVLGLGNDNVSKITIMSTVFTRPSVATTIGQLHLLTRTVIRP